MYQHINRQIDAILSSPEAEANAKEYDWLRENVRRAGDGDYQKRYRIFWAMNAARLCDGYCQAYFRELQAANEKPPDLADLTRKLYDIAAYQNGNKALQFSFATKLLHMVKPESPVYDSQVAEFYFFWSMESSRPFEERLGKLLHFHKFLSEEYARVIEGNLLEDSIGKFRERLKPRHYSDVRVIDSLIWGFVGLLRNGAVVERRVVYR